MDAGFFALPVDPETKAPLPYLTPRGLSDATDDPQTWQQWLALAPDAGSGIVPGTRFVVIDDDLGQVDAGAYGVAGTFAERTRRGIHYWAQLPGARHLRKSKLPNGAGDIITGDRAYVVVSPTPPYHPIDISAPVLTLPENSPLWELAGSRHTLTTYAFKQITEQDKADACEVMNRLRHGKFAKGLDSLFSGDWPKLMPHIEDTSESTRDFLLVLEASHFLREHDRADQVLAALLLSTGWPSSPDRQHPKKNPMQYTAIVVGNALSSRFTRDAKRLNKLYARFVAPFVILPDNQQTPPKNLKPKSVLVGTPLHGGGHRGVVIEDVVLEFLANDKVDEFTRTDRWRRLPVSDLAAVLGVNRKTITRTLERLKACGLIEREVIALRHDGAYRRDSLARLVPSS